VGSEEEDVIAGYILLSYALAYVKSADNGTINEPVLDTKWSLYPNIHCFV